jgi:hypothetical protein
MAMKFPVSCKLPTVIALGMMTREISPSEDTGPVPVPLVTVTGTLLEARPLNPIAVAVIVVVPLPSAVTKPVEAPTCAMPVEAEVQVTPVVMFWVEAWAALPYFPVAVN